MINRLSVATVGTWFNKDTEYIGYLPVGVIGGLIGAIMFGIGFAYNPLFLYHAVYLPVLMFALTMSFCSASSVRSSIGVRCALGEYYSLTKDERKMLPNNTAKYLIKADNYTVTEAVQNLIYDIQRGRVDYATDNFLQEIADTRKAVQIRNDTMKEMM